MTTTAIEARMKKALEKLASIMEDPTIAGRNPVSSLSFSCLAQDVAKSQWESLRFYSKNLDKAYKPLGPDGRPLRKFSQRNEAHWFYGEKDGISYAGNGDILLRSSKQEGSTTPEGQLPLPQSEPITTKEDNTSKTNGGNNSPETGSGTTTTGTGTGTVDMRLRRGTFTPNSVVVDKMVIKGSMAKVVSSTQVVPLRNILM
ncbi:hypothetical protein AX16_000112 [Volvariella volvacea WC 439]|nr:hypothetical protein AX16_000112 [Volvariella volvacea WC 439]